MDFSLISQEFSWQYTLNTKKRKQKTNKQTTTKTAHQAYLPCRCAGFAHKMFISVF